MDKTTVLGNYGDTEIEEAFGNAFGELAPYHYVNSYEIVFAKDYDKKENQITVEVSSMADSPTREQFEKIAQLLVIDMNMIHDGKPVTMKLKEVISLNPMEYHAVYIEASGMSSKDVGVVYDSDQEIEGALPDISNLSGSSEPEK